MKSLLYISSLPRDSQSGGANAVNYHTYRELQKYFDCTYVQINPPESKWGKWVSQIRRKLLKRPGRFNFFGEKRLREIARQFAAIPGKFDYVFFRGFTPWVLCQPKVPYVAYNDVHFLQFFRNTFDEQAFIASDIQRICTQEKQWLAKARAITFESAWGAEQCAKDYKISGTPQIPVGRGGHIPLPEQDTYDGSLCLLIIANNFYQKGGDLTFAAFQELKRSHPRLELHIVGGPPPATVLQEAGVVYHGYLYKENSWDLEALVHLLSQAFLLIHLTREDTNPLVITEAGYFGCPAISVDRFAIPELIKHNETGILVPDPVSIKKVIKVIDELLFDGSHYKMLRKECYHFNRNTFTWDSIVEKILILI